MDHTPFTFEYAPPAIHQGPGVVDGLDDVLADNGSSRALIVTDGTLAEIPDVMEPIRTGLGTSHVRTCDAVTPPKYIASAVSGAEMVEELGADAIVAVGGGSSLDVAKQIRVLVGYDDSPEAVAERFVREEAVTTPPSDVSFIDMIAIPTTLPGADISQVAGVNLSLDPEGQEKRDVPSDGFSDPRLMPTAVFHDLELFRTTPDHILARSAMNGFDKGIEMLYTRHHNPITDGVAVRGVRLLSEHLPAIHDNETSDADLAGMLRGIAAAQYGLSSPRHYRASIIHSFGHAIQRDYEVQQGVAHAIAAPHVLEDLFEQVDGRRELVGEALDVTPPDDVAGIVDAVAAVRDALELPSQLRTLEGVDRDDIPDLAAAVIADPFMDAAPRELNAEQSEIEDVFRAMW